MDSTKRWLARGRGLVLPIVLIALWELMSRQGAAQAYAFVPLEAIGRGLRELMDSGELAISTFASLQRTCLGLAIGATVGVIIGGLMASSAVAERVFGPLYHILRQIPILGLIPLIALWFGSGEGAKLLVVSLAAFYPMTLNTFQGFTHVEKRYREVGSIFALSRTQQLTQVLLPSALPSIANGLLHALAFAWVSSVGSELFMSTGAGLGNLMMNAEAGSRMEVVIIGVLCIGLLGYAMNQLFSRLSNFLLRWRDLR